MLDSQSFDLGWIHDDTMSVRVSNAGTSPSDIAAAAAAASAAAASYLPDVPAPMTGTGGPRGFSGGLAAAPADYGRPPVDLSSVWVSVGAAGEVTFRKPRPCGSVRVLPGELVTLHCPGGSSQASVMVRLKLDACDGHMDFQLGAPHMGAPERTFEFPDLYPLCLPPMRGSPYLVCHLEIYMSAPSSSSASCSFVQCGVSLIQHAFRIECLADHEDMSSAMFSRISHVPYSTIPANTKISSTIRVVPTSLHVNISQERHEQLIVLEGGMKKALQRKRMQIAEAQAGGEAVDTPKPKKRGRGIGPMPAKQKFKGTSTKKQQQQEAEEGLREAERHQQQEAEDDEEEYTGDQGHVPKAASASRMSSVTQKFVPLIGHLRVQLRVAGIIAQNQYVRLNPQDQKELRSKEYKKTVTFGQSNPTRSILHAYNFDPSSLIVHHGVVKKNRPKNSLCTWMWFSDYIVQSRDRFSSFFMPWGPNSVVSFKTEILRTSRPQGISHAEGASGLFRCRVMKFVIDSTGDWIHPFTTAWFEVISNQLITMGVQRHVKSQPVEDHEISDDELDVSTALIPHPPCLTFKADTEYRRDGDWFDALDSLTRLSSPVKRKKKDAENGAGNDTTAGLDHEMSKCLSDLVGQAQFDHTSHHTLTQHYQQQHYQQQHYQQQHYQQQHYQQQHYQQQHYQQQHYQQQHYQNLTNPHFQQIHQTRSHQLPAAQIVAPQMAAPQTVEHQTMAPQTIAAAAAAAEHLIPPAISTIRPIPGMVSEAHELMEPTTFTLLKYAGMIDDDGFPKSLVTTSPCLEQVISSSAQWTMDDAVTSGSFE